MAKQTINIGASPNDGTGTPLRTSFDYCNLNFTELYTAVGPSGNNIVCPGSATISGNLTVDTNTLFVDAANNRVGFGTATPNAAVEVRNAGAQQRWDSGGATDARVELWANSLRQGLIGWNSNSIVFGGDSARNTVMTWQDVGGVAGTAMTLNATGLGVGMSPLTDRLTIFGSAGVNVSGGFADISFRNSPGTAIQRIRYTDGSGTLTIGSPLGTSYPVELGGNTTTRAVTIDASSNVGIGVTPKSWASGYRALQIGIYSALTDAQGGATYLTNNAYFDSVDSRWEYITNNRVVRYDQDTADGGHKWYSAGSGAVNAAITWGNPLMTLDASGNLLVGATSAGGNRLNVQTASGDCLMLVKSQAANTNLVIDYVSNYGNYTIRKSGTAVWDYGVISDSSATPAFKIQNASSVGVQLVSGATAWTTLSDETVKDIIEPISNAVAKVGSLRSVIGKFKTDDSSKRRSFLIAQDVQSVLPEAVDVIGENNELGLRYTEVIPLLVAAIKELTAEVNALKKA